MASHNRIVRNITRCWGRLSNGPIHSVFVRNQLVIMRFCRITHRCVILQAVFLHELYHHPRITLHFAATRLGLSHWTKSAEHSVRMLLFLLCVLNQ